MVCALSPFAAGLFSGLRPFQYTLFFHLKKTFYG
jgi:hypothetical protein